MGTAGERFGEFFEIGGCVALCGDLGAGKTHFTKGLVRGLGGDEDGVTSPTFTIINEYSGCRLPVFHFDFYRMESVGEVVAAGWDEYLDAGGLTVVEWADKFPELMPPGTWWFYFRALDNGVREVDVSDGYCG